jgi:hypothetical protein
MKASLWGAHLMALPSISGCLGTINLRPPKVGMPRVALPDSLQPCRISECLYTPYDQD